MLGFCGKKLSPEEAKDIAQAVCRERGWTFLEPVRVDAGLFSWIIVTNGGSMGAKARIKVSKKDKKVLHAGYIKR